MKIALFYGHYSSNIGDVAINRGLADILGKSFGKTYSLTVFFLNGDGKKLNGRISFGDVENISFKSVYADVSLALKCVQNPEMFLSTLGVSDFDLILVNGGEHLFSSKNNPNWMNLFWRSLPLISANSNKIRSLVLPSTIGFFDHNSAMQYSQNFLKGPTSFLCRDTTSYNYLKKDLAIDKVAILPDLAFNIDFDVEATGGVRHNDTVGIIIRPDKMGLRVGTDESKVESAKLKEFGFEESVSFKFGLSSAKAILNGSTKRLKIFIQADADKGISTELYSALDKYTNSNRVELVMPNSVDDYLKELSMCGCVVTSRLHAAILSYVVNTPCVAYYFEEHGHKMPGVFKLLSASNNCFLLTERNVEKNAKETLQRIENAIEDQVNIKQRIDLLKKDSIDYFRQVLKTPVDYPNSVPLTSFPEWLEGISIETASGEVKSTISKKNSRVKEVLDARTKASERLKHKYKELESKNKELKERNNSLEARLNNGHLITKLFKTIRHRS